MLQNRTILVAGGDLRQAQLARLLAENNRVYTIGLEKAEGLQEYDVSPLTLQESGLKFDYIVFPMPVGCDDETVNTPFSAKRVRIDEVLELAGADTWVLGGKLGGSFLAKLEQRGLLHVDYFLREELAVLNAIPTVLAIRASKKNDPTREGRTITRRWRSGSAKRRDAAVPATILNSKGQATALPVACPFLNFHRRSSARRASSSSRE